MAPANFKRSSSTTSKPPVGSPLLSNHQRRQLKPSRTVYNQLDDYQKNVVHEAIEAKGFGVFSEQGTGKTYIAGGIIELLLGQKKTTRFPFNALAVVPLNNLETTWVPLLEQTGLRICRSLEEIAFGGDYILLLHYEAVPAIIKRLRRIKFTIIIYDECHRLKDRASLQSRTAAKLRNSAVWKIGLSGTPIEKQPQDVWAQFRFFAPDVFGTHWKDFEFKYLESVPDLLKDKNGKLKYRPGSMRFKRALFQMHIMKNRRKFLEDKLPDFLERIKPHCCRIDADDVLDLPLLNLIRQPLRARGLQRQVYEQIEAHSFLDLGEDRITCPVKVSQLWKLHQACGGYILTDEENIYEVGRAKLRRTLHIVKQEELPIVIFCFYLEEAWSLQKELVDRTDLRVTTYTGKTPKDMRPEVQRAFQRGEIDVLICQIRTGGVGIDLFRSCTGIVYSCRHSFIDFDQAMKRLRRRGQTKAVNMYLLYILGTIDESIYDAVASKRQLTTRVLTALIRRKHSSWPRKLQTTSTALTRLRKISTSSQLRSELRSGATRSRRTPMASMAGTARRTTSM